jgi:hypothetical protein
MEGHALLATPKHRLAGRRRVVSHYLAPTRLRSFGVAGSAAPSNY